jgi:glutaconate CoA-transferase subunit B
LVITNLAVMDWQGPNNQLRVLSVHPGVSVDDVVANTGFEIFVPDVVGVTSAPTVEQLEIIRQLDPHNIRARQLKDNPPGVRVSQTAEKESVV